MFGGSVASLAVLGEPDITLIALTELAEQMRRCRAPQRFRCCPMRSRLRQCAERPPTVQELEAAGAGGLTIEDTLLPQGLGRPGRS